MGVIQSPFYSQTLEEKLGGGEAPPAHCLCGKHLPIKQANEDRIGGLLQEGRVRGHWARHIAHDGLLLLRFDRLSIYHFHHRTDQPDLRHQTQPDLEFLGSPWVL